MVYFYDFENLSTHGFEGYGDLSTEDTLVVFYSEKNKQWDIDSSLELMQNCKAKLKFVKTAKTMPNYADFQICTLLGACVREGNACSIISSDKGYISVIDYWKEDKFFGKPSIVQLAQSLKDIKKDKGGLIGNNEPAPVSEAEAKAEVKETKEVKTTKTTKKAEKAEKAVEPEPEAKVETFVTGEDTAYKDTLTKIMNACSNLARYKFRLKEKFGDKEGQTIYDNTKEEFKKLKQGK